MKYGVYLAAMKIVLTLVLTAALSPLFGQIFFDAGIKGGYGPTFLFNQNISDDGKYGYALTSGYTFGGKLGVHFHDHHGFTVDFMGSKSKQNFDLPGNGSHDYDWKHNDLLIMYRYSGNGAYVEIGPEISFLRQVNSSVNGSPKQDVSPNFVDNYKLIVFGFGSYLAGTELLSVQAGVRLHWAFDDMVSAQGKENDFPATQTSHFANYTKSHATAAQFMVEVNYAFGRFAKASCSQRWRLILFESR